MNFWVWTAMWLPPRRSYGRLAEILCLVEIVLHAPKTESQTGASYDILSVGVSFSLWRPPGAKRRLQYGALREPSF